MDMKKYILAIILAIVILIGFNQYLDDGVGTDSVTPIAGQTYTLAGSGISSSDTSITLTSFTITQTGYEILDSDMSEIFYLTLEPGSRSRQEIVSCTTVTQNSDDTATLSGCERGLQPFSPYSSSTDYAFAHSGGSTVIFSNPPQLYNQAAFKDNDAIITGSWLFPTPLSNDSAATKGYVDSVVSGTTTLSNDRLIVTGTAGETLATGTLVYFKGTDQEWYKVDTDDSTTYQDKFIGLTQGSGVNAGFINGGVLLKGRDVTQTGLTAGSTYYANTVAGNISTVISAQPIGTAEDTNILYFDPVMIDVVREGTNNVFTGLNTFSPTTITGHASTTIRVYTASSTWTKPEGLEYIIVEVQGAGGDGSNNAGGGAGGYSKNILSSSTLSATTSVAVVIGAAGIGSGTTTFGGFLSSGNGTDASGDTNGVGGVAVGGILNINGQSGSSDSGGLGSKGGDSVLGNSGGVTPFFDVSGTSKKGAAAGFGYGAGGSGCADASDGAPACTTNDAAAGMQGIIIITEFY